MTILGLQHRRGGRLLYSVLAHDEGEIGLAEADDGDKEEDDADEDEQVEGGRGSEVAFEGIDEMAVETQDEDGAYREIGNQARMIFIEQLRQKIDECGACHTAEEE